MNSTGRKLGGRILEIDEAQPLSVRLPVGFAVHCIAGQAWLTQEGLIDDVILAAGEEFVVQERGVTVISGIRGAALVYLSAGARQRAGEKVTLTGDFLDAARARAAELRREEWSRLTALARRFVLRVVKRTKAMLPTGSDWKLSSGLNAKALGAVQVDRDLLGHSPRE
ncbi:MAG: DUF2917 domain-containing protein [Betaproteobacteria bacterium]|nr:DUF2917 domain-containing protein [Betaproteobacteria bacterium]